MAEKNSVDVLVGGKVIKLAGYESEEYLQQVAAYMDRKANDLKEVQGYNHMSAELRNILLALNIADDYYKARRQADEYDGDIGSKDEEIYALKQKLVQADMDLEKARNDLAKAHGDLEKAQGELEMTRSELKRTQGELDEARKAARGTQQKLWQG